MKIFSFEDDLAHPIEQFGSVGVRLVRIANRADTCRIGYFRISPGGVIGYHQAVTAQLFMVVQGQGWVRGEHDDPIPIQAGQAAYWTAGEWHESGSKTGLEAIVIEISGNSFDPEEYLVKLEDL